MRKKQKDGYKTADFFRGFLLLGTLHLSDGKKTAKKR
jgi:hypothetical protein